MATHTYSLAVTYNCGGQFAQNILHYQFDDGGFTNTAAAAEALCNAYDIANTNVLKGILSLHCSILSYKARALNVFGGFEGLLLLPAPVVGLRAGNLSVSGIGPVIIQYPVANAPGRGRVFLPGISDVDCVDGNMTAAYQAAVASAIHIFTDTLTLSGGGSPVATPVLYHTKPPPPASRVIQYARLSLMVGTIRRRQRPA